MLTADASANVPEVVVVFPPTLPPAPSPPAYVPPPAPPAPTPVPIGETLAQAEAAVYALVQSGMTPPDALAAHPLPAGTSTAQALAFLASLPQTTTQFGVDGSTVVTGPPLTAPVVDPGNVEPLPDPTAYNGFVFSPFFGEGGGLSEAEANAKVLRGAGFTQSMVKWCNVFNIDAKAAAANAMDEGLGGGIGDQGQAYGAWQIWATDGRLSQFAGLPPYSPEVQGWAWTDNGIEYAIRSMKAGGAAGKVGHASVYAIVYGFERPSDKVGAVKTRDANYDHLVALGSGWDNYISSQANGPSLIATGVTPPKNPTVSGSPKTLTGKPVQAAWREFIYTFSRDMPFAANHAKTISDELVDLVK